MHTGVTRDSAAITRLSAPDAANIGPDGSVETGARQIGDVMAGTISPTTRSAPSRWTCAPLAPRPPW